MGILLLQAVKDPLGGLGSVVQSIIGGGILGSALVLFVYLYIRERKRNEVLHIAEREALEKLHKFYLGKLDDFTAKILESAKKQTEVIVRNTEVLQDMKNMTQRVLYDIQVSRTPSQGTPLTGKPEGE